jgi:AIPR protein
VSSSAFFILEKIVSDIHLVRIRTALHKLFDGHIDLSDYGGKPQADRDTAFLSRSLAAYVLTLLTPLDAAAVEPYVTDGFDDNGLDALYFDSEAKILYLVQSKWRHSGKGTFSRSDCSKLLNGIKDLVNLRLERFNDRVRTHHATLKQALEDSDVRIQFALAHPGTDSLSIHVESDIEQFLEEMNDPVELFTCEAYNQGRLYSSVQDYAQRRAIDLTIPLQDWGHAREPFQSYYGNVEASAVAEWWTAHGRALFARNLRTYRGSTDVNGALSDTLKANPQNFWYFNNGITILCSSVTKAPKGASSRATALLDCSNVSIVNGAQTVGVIGSLAGLLSTNLQHARVALRIISLQGCPDGFDKQVARATNTQNRIEYRDFAALDPNQQRLANELYLDGIFYTYKTGDTAPPNALSCTIVDATVALACASSDLSLAVQAKREVGRLWQDIEKEPYTRLFNDRTTAIELWRAVQIMRAVEAALGTVPPPSSPRASLAAIHGNRLVLHRVFLDPRICKFRQPREDIDAILEIVPEVTDSVIKGICTILDRDYPNAYLASLFKNHEKCDHVAGLLTQQMTPPAPSPPADSPGNHCQGDLFT